MIWTNLHFKCRAAGALFEELGVQKIWFVKILGKISKKLSNEDSKIFNNTNKIILFYWACK